MRSLVFLASLVLATGCCKVACEDDSALTVSLQRFPARDTDSIQVLRYSPDGSRLLDSSFQSFPADARDSSYSRVNLRLEAGPTWKIRVVSLNREFVFQDILLQNGQCSCGGDRYSVVNSYVVDGVKKDGNLFLP